MAEVIEEPSFRDRVYIFNDRFHAGELLAEKLREYGGREDVYVLAIPAGGVQVALPIVNRLRLPMDLAVTRKLHVPWNREAGFGALTWDGTLFLNEPLVSALSLTREEIDSVVAEEREEICRRLKLFRGDKPFPDIRNKVVIIVDDGLASGFSMLATAKSIEEGGAKEIIAAVPTASLSAINLLKPHVDRIVCLNIRTGPVFAVADAYKQWYDLEDKDVMKLLIKLD
jgi:putative phosphoribosyl transferase